MRQLTSLQKKILIKYLENCTPLNYPLKPDDLPFDVYDKIEEINDYETLWQDLNRFLWDYRFKKDL